MKQVFLKSIEQTFTKKFSVWLFGSAGSLNALLLIPRNFINSEIVTNLLYTGLVIAGIYTLRFLIFFGRNLYRFWYDLYKESVYGDAIVFLADAFSIVHWLRKEETITDEQLKTTMSKICEQIKKIFDKKTKSKCSVSIKLCKKMLQSADTPVKNLCRDQASKSRDTEAYMAYDHKVFANTCFNWIFNNFTQDKPRNHLFYLNNDIPNTRDYANTSKAVNLEGKIDYESELVVPIYPLHADTGKDFAILGFLCVDCKIKNVFDTKYDVAILQGVADGIYDIIFKHKTETNS